MAIRQDGFYYNQQLRKWIYQFMNVFYGLQVHVGKSATEEERLVTVPIAYGHRERVVASIIAENTQNKMLRLPTMSCYMRNLRLDTSRLSGVGTGRRQTYTPVGGLVPDDTRVIHQMKPVPYIMEVELGLYASNTDQHCQMLEQIIPHFNPTVQIQTSDAIFDWARQTTIDLKNVQLDSNFPIGNDRRICQSTLTFEVAIWIDIPADVHDDFIKKIYVRLGAVSSGATTHAEMIYELDEQGIPYQLWADGSNLKLD